MAYEMIWETRGVYRRFYGRTSDLDVTESTRITEASSRFDELRYAILDFLEVDEIVIVNPSFIQETAAIDAAAALSNPNIKVAIVTVSQLIREMAEAYIANELSPYPTQIFTNLADARDWVAAELPPKGRFQPYSN
jgi:hypothetical protein